MDSHPATPDAPPRVLSGHWLRTLVRSRRDGPVEISLDLGMTRVTVNAKDDRVCLPGGPELDRRAIRDMKFRPEDCFVAAAAGLEKIYIFSEERHHYYKLYQARADWPPTIVINNAPMHVILRHSPLDDTARKLEAVARPGRSPDFAGARVLDTCFGLGYTAMLAARAGARQVDTCEVDEHVLGIARLNPWAREVFRTPRIAIHAVDSRDFLAHAADGQFDLILHDPPTITLAGELYADAVYAQLYRVLKPGGRLYHYTGDPGGRLGHDMPGKVGQRLTLAGFKRVKRAWGGLVGVR